ncbi:hypothetical protein HPHPA11_1271 [Helicobacter pylori Hp A-11]|uniref:Uncharacterized protein n=1 Tax=Helicobacter pylori Hp A-11 TaxID=992035 RepID=N4TR80_HELPX|nr:hypothetical protein HPHPA11_1271 [Helicobacter pylori Hp A-11]
MKFIIVQKVNHSTFFIIKHDLNEFKFCFTRFVKTLYPILSAKKTLLLRLG